eukprot:Nitzschia sp. Nitz4//scaffold29_size155292//138387//139229//NITZ4_002688-RA/size155292-processed-gene-0.30-mRNA-1//1//CDS//3329546538//2963//frame0
MCKSPTTEMQRSTVESVSPISKHPKRAISSKVSLKGLVATLKRQAKKHTPFFDKEDCSVGSSSCTTAASTVCSDCSSGSHTSSKKKKSVSFAKNVRVSLTMGRDEITDEEFASAWYNENEFLDIADDCFDLVKQVRRGELSKVPRGLERLSKTGMKQAIENRKASIYMVLDEQDLQIRDGIYDEDCLAYLYHNVTSSSQLWATAVGGQDQKEAENVYDDDDDGALEELHFAEFPAPRNPRDERGLKGILVVDGKKKAVPPPARAPSQQAPSRTTQGARAA